MKKVEELRVIDLRNELEKRGLDKSGVKAVLVKRLKDAMMEDNSYSKLLETGNDINSNEQQNVDHSIEEQDSLNSDKECMHSEETLVCSDETDCVSPTKNDSSTSNCIYQGAMGTDNKKAISDAQQPVNVADFDEKENEWQEEEAKDGYTVLGGTEEPEERTQDTENEDQELQQDFKEDHLVDTENTEEEKTEASVEPISELVSIGEEEEQLLDEDNSSTNQGLLEDESLNILFEDEDKILDYEENERMEMDEPVLHNEAKEAEEVDTKDFSILEKEKQLSKEGSKYTNVNGSKSTNAEHIDKNTSETNDKPVGNRNVWVSGLASNTRAQDLKMLFCKHGKVISVKIVANSKSSSAKCFGFVTMNNAEEVDECIRHLNRTELHGRLIQVEKAKGEPGTSKVSLKGDARSPSNASNASCVSRSKASSERRGRTSPGLNRSRKHSPIVIGGYRSRSPRDRARSFSRDRGPRPIKGSLDSDRSAPRNGRNIDDIHRRFSPRRGSVLNFNRIKEERERERSRMRERMIRDKERMRFREEEKLRILERKQKEEAYRLKRERDLLRIEREKMEREKEKLLRLEREQHRVERERLERERDEMQRMKHRSRPPRRSPSPPPHPRASGRSFPDRRKGPPLGPPSSSRDYREMPKRRSPPLAPVRRGFQEQGRGVGAKRSPVPPPPPPSLRGIGYERGRSSDLKRSPPSPSHRNDRVFHRRSDGYSSSSSNRNRSLPLHPHPPPALPPSSKSSSFQSSSSYHPRNSSPHRPNSSHYDDGGGGGKTNSSSSGMWRSGSEAISSSNNSRPPPSQSNSWRSDGGRWVSGSVGVPIRTSSYNVDNEAPAIPFPAPGFGTGSLTHQHRYDSMNHYKS